MSSIDASIIGLRPTLQLLQQYYQSGILQADIRSAFHMQGPYIAYIEILEGNIVSCYLQNRAKQYEPTEIEVLLRLDATEGPFAWRLYPQEQKQLPGPGALEPAPAQAQPAPQQQLTPYTVPRRLAPLDLSWLTTWSPQQKRTLRMVYAMIDGQRTVAAIERSTPIPNVDVQKALVILIAMHIITIESR
ncbi:MAG TPA: hypothetical protein VGF67_19405 [Ktedonobacteraceae bacterium]|jgi:hypothetical protein